MNDYEVTDEFDQFGQEHWDSACDNMPQEYLDDVMAQIDAIQPARFILDNYDPKNIWDRKHIAEIARDFALYHPREGQPDLQTQRITPWFEEGLLRQDEIRASWARRKRK